MAQRQAFGETMVSLAQDDARILVLDGDVGSSTGAGVFEEAHPKRYLQTGIGEQNMVAMAAGLSTLDFVPFVTTFSCFAVARALDSVRVLVAQPSLNVKLIGGYAGLLTGMTGKTHQMFDDVAIMRSLPNMTVLAPADEVEVRQVIRAVAALDGPAYVQITREPEGIIFGDDYRFELGKAVTLREGSDATLVSTGAQSVRVYEAAEMLARRGIDVGVLHVPTIKPLDEGALVRAATMTGFMITIEEQSVIGGLGGAVAEVLADRFPVTVKRLGIKDCFGESGPNDLLLEKYRLSAMRVAEDVETLLGDALKRRPMGRDALQDQWNAPGVRRDRSLERAGGLMEKHDG
jgi:transketolase